MRVPRRKISAFTETWTPGKISGVALMACVMLIWGSVQLMMYAKGLHGMETWLQLDARGHYHDEYWRLLTYQFVHWNILHLLANLLVIYFAGREVELVIGRRHFLGLCLCANFVGALVSWQFAPADTVMGFSAAAAAVLVAYSTILPEFEHTFVFFQITRLRFRARHLTVAVVLLTLVALATQTALPIGPAGMMASFVLGWAWSRQLGFGNPLWIQRVIFDRRQRVLRHQRMNAGQFIEVEIDPILEKISRTGMKSLTRAERKLLELGRQKMTGETMIKR